MSFARQIRNKLNEMGFRPDMGREIEEMRTQLSVCQIVVVVMSLVSVVCLIVPFFYTTEPWFVAVFFLASIISISFGVWFWVKRGEICEHPEEINE